MNQAFESPPGLINRYLPSLLCVIIGPARSAPSSGICAMSSDILAWFIYMHTSEYNKTTPPVTHLSRVSRLVRPSTPLHRHPLQMLSESPPRLSIVVFLDLNASVSSSLGCNRGSMTDHPLTIASRPALLTLYHLMHSSKQLSELEKAKNKCRRSITSDSCYILGSFGLRRGFRFMPSSSLIPSQT